MEKELCWLVESSKVLSLALLQDNYAEPNTHRVHDSISMTYLQVGTAMRPQVNERFTGRCDRGWRGASDPGMRREHPVLTV